MSDQSLLVKDKLQWDSLVRDNIKKIKQTIKDHSTSKIMMYNKYEKVAPFNLWFHCPLYRICNYYENNQNIRIRYFNSLMITPLVSCDNTSILPIKSFLGEMSLYQPYYPETFFSGWEFLQMKHLNPNFKDFIYIGKEIGLGLMESLILYNERYKPDYQSNIYHCWFNENKPKVDYLGQTYKVSYIDHINTVYQCIIIDDISIFEKVFQWDNEERDLQNTIYYILESIQHLENDGSLLIRMNMIGSVSWSVIFDITYPCFKEHSLLRPSITNPLNPEIYLFLNKFRHSPKINSSRNQILKSLCQHKVYQNFYLNIQSNKKNIISQKYQTCVKNWLQELSKMPKKSKNHHVSEWFSNNSLAQIKKLKNEFDYLPIKGSLKTISKPFTLRIYPETNLFDQPFYQKLIQNRSELNSFKRVMDTKPSKIFSSIHGNNHNNYLLTWEQLTQYLDPYQGLKFLLKSQFKAEMVTNAWLKMYEIIHLFPQLIPKGAQINQRIKTFHICEAPGAFVSAINHYTSTKSINLDWYAQSLNPKCSKSRETIDDHFGLISNYPDKWLFGDPLTDQSGDITHSKIIRYYASNPILKDLELITADAGLQCDPKDLNEQEGYLAKVNMGQIMCILACLSVGKSAIFKTFLPLIEPLTVSMLYLLSNLFSQVNITKPCSSHSSNSEVYVVLIGYKGIKKSTLNTLYNMLDDANVTSQTFLFESLDPYFIKSYIKNVEMFVDRQIQSLDMHYYYYYHLDELSKLMNNSDKYVDDWITENPVEVLGRSLLRD